MRWHYIEITGDSNREFGESRDICYEMFRSTDIVTVKWDHGKNFDTHFWKIQCTDEQKLILSLKGAKFLCDLTQTWIESGLEKLQPEEIDALGLTSLLNLTNNAVQL